MQNQNKEVVKDITTAVQLENELQISQAQHGVAVVDVYNAEWGSAKALNESFRRLYTDAGDMVHLRFFSVECNMVLDSLKEPADSRAAPPRPRTAMRNYHPDTTPTHWTPILEARCQHSKPYFIFFKEGKQVGTMEGIDTPKICKYIKELCEQQNPYRDYITNEDLLRFWGLHYKEFDSEVTTESFVAALEKEGFQLNEATLEALYAALGTQSKGKITAAAVQAWMGEESTVKAKIASITVTSSSITNEDALEFWNKYFKDQKETPFEEFEGALRQEGYDLGEDSVTSLRSSLEVSGDGLVHQTNVQSWVGDSTIRDRIASFRNRRKSQIQFKEEGTEPGNSHESEGLHSSPQRPESIRVGGDSRNTSAVGSSILSDKNRELGDNDGSTGTGEDLTQFWSTHFGEEKEVSFETFMAALRDEGYELDENGTSTLRSYLDVAADGTLTYESAQQWVGNSTIRYRINSIRNRRRSQIQSRDLDGNVQVSRVSEMELNKSKSLMQSGPIDAVMESPADSKVGSPDFLADQYRELGDNDGSTGTGEDLTQFWITHFGEEKEVSFETFMAALRDEGYELDENGTSTLRSYLDVAADGTLTYESAQQWVGNSTIRYRINSIRNRRRSQIQSRDLDGNVQVSRVSEMELNKSKSLMQSGPIDAVMESPADSKVGSPDFLADQERSNATPKTAEEYRELGEEETEEKQPEAPQADEEDQYRELDDSQGSGRVRVAEVDESKLNYSTTSEERRKSMHAQLTEAERKASHSAAAVTVNQQSEEWKELDEADGEETTTTTKVTRHVEGLEVNQIFVNEKWITVTGREMEVWNKVADLPLHFPENKAVNLISAADDFPVHVPGDDLDTLDTFVESKGVEKVDFDIMCLAADAKVGSESLSLGKLALALMTTEQDSVNSLIPGLPSLFDKLSEGTLLEACPPLAFTAICLCSSDTYPDEVFNYVATEAEIQLLQQSNEGEEVVLKALSPLQSEEVKDGISVQVLGVPKVIELASTDDVEGTVVLSQWHCKLKVAEKSDTEITLEFVENLASDEFEAFVEKYTDRLIESDGRLDKKADQDGSPAGRRKSKQEYRPVLALQEAIYKAKIERQTKRLRKETTLPSLPDITLLVEHRSPVYTLGRRDTSSGLPDPPIAEVIATRRGGGVTWHGPGQLTVYPIVQVQELWKGCSTREKPRSPIVWYSEVLERCMQCIASGYSIPTHPYRTGVWADAYDGAPHRKLGSIGLQLGSWVSMHGAGLNIHNDLHYFDHIIMCELPGESATSLCEEIKKRGVSVDTMPTVATVAPLFYTQLHTHLAQSEDVYSYSAVTDLSGEKEWRRVVLQAMDPTALPIDTE